jgi:hypothetical protein
MTLSPAVRWISFLRQYGPISRNDAMYDEHIRRSARRAGIRPLAFKHPVEDEVLPLFSGAAAGRDSVILTGTAGDGKSHLCRKVWNELGGGEAEWGSDDVYHTRAVTLDSKPITVHVLRDLTALPTEDPKGRYRNKAELLATFCNGLFGLSGDEVFLVAANDGQLIETLHKLPASDQVIKARALIEALLVEDRRERDGVPLKFFNLSRVPCTRLFDLALDAFLDHEGWKDCYAEASSQEEFFGPHCPIRHNYELLKTPLVRARLRALFELCDCNDLHIPIRRILLLFANGVLGHPDVRDRLMQAADVLGVVRGRTSARASLFNNLFGGNLTETRRESLEVFDYMNRFRIGHETSNRVDNTLIFGEADDNLRPYFEELLGADAFYGADESYYAAQREYVEGGEGGEGRAFLDLLVSQRRGLFFKIPERWEQELALWELTVFKYAGEYLARVVNVLRAGGKVERPILARLVRGLNRIFVGMLVSSDRDVLLATSISISTSKVSQVIEDRIPVAPRMHERVDLLLRADKPALVVHLAPELEAALPLNLTRYEFLSRVAEGALPGSFSRECYEDMLAFKSRLLSCLAARRRSEGADGRAGTTFRLLTLDPSGNPLDEVVEFVHG